MANRGVDFSAEPSSGLFGGLRQGLGLAAGGVAGAAAGAVGAGAGLIGGTLRGRPLAGLTRGACEWAEGGYNVGDEVARGTVRATEEVTRCAATGAGAVIGGTGGAALGLAGGVCNGRPLQGMRMGITEHGCCGAEVGDDLARDPLHVAYAAAMVGAEAVEDITSVIARAPLRITQAFVNDFFHKHHSVNSDEIVCALASKFVYREPHLRVRKCTLGGNDITLDEDINWTRLALYWLNKGRSGSKMILAFKGTNSSADLAPDLLIILGALAAQQTAADEKLRAMMGARRSASFCQFLKEEHGKGSALLATGHSLGGAAAMTCGSCRPSCTFVDQCFAFNPGTGPIKQHDTDLHNSILDWISNLKGVRGIQNLHAQDYSRTSFLQFIAGDAPDKIERRVQVHHILGDPVSMCTTASWKSRVRTWAIAPQEVRHPGGPALGLIARALTAHDQNNFLNPDWWTEVADAGSNKQIRLR